MFSKKDLMNLESVIMLYAVKKNEGKRMAAKDLNTSIDTLNKYLENLESELGTKLISVNDRRCSLTSNGEKVVEIVGQLKSCLQKVYNVASVEKDVKGEVRIAYDINTRNNFSVRNVQHLCNKYPAISFLIETFDDVPDMHSMDYDICLSNDIPKGEDIVVVASRDIPCGYFASSHYLKVHPYPQSFDDLLENHRLVLRKDCWKWFADGKKLLQKAQKGTFLSDSVFVVNEVIMTGGGVGIMPLFFAGEGQNLVCLDNIPCESSLTLYLVSHRSVKDIPKIRTVLEYYKDILQNL